ncbi:AI-2E family transporter [Hydrogenophaga sp.]|uniref:AI-2E family transporter n=1 Tax=Hydrogenophaga sp. TaxID=1904254 RepID=UPI002731B22F|nr:AI-2E family transporter [Hydrogenophaga sp.]MDP2015596.1 AI-2E family transporter [Hydrogenophaga sp.]MDP3167193.1 AI-2E family transporter [Hydrogenophaga sp.]
MQEPETSLPLPQRLLAVAVVVTALYFGRDLLIPLALATLLAFVLAPLTDRIRRLGVPRAVTVTVVVAITLGALVGLSLFMAGHVRVLGKELPTYQRNIAAKFDRFRVQLRTPGVFSEASRVIDAVESEIEQTQGEFDDKPATGTRRPARVELVPTTPGAFETVGRWLERIGPPAALFGTTLIYLFLVLLNPGDLRDRLVSLLGGSVHRTTDALNDAGQRVSRYLTMQLVVNLCYAVPMAAGLWLIGIPGALLWGLLSAVLRFIPYVGSLVGAAFPLMLAFAVDPGWTMVAWALALIVVLELISNNIVEPWLYGSSTGLSAMSLIVAATFWTALWGPIGLVLSTPLTVCMLVIGRHLPQLAFLDVMLGSRPALELPSRMYQRLLAGNSADAIELAEESVAGSSPRQFYEDVGIPVLRMATVDHRLQEASAEHRHRIVSGMSAVIDELRVRHAAERPQAPLEALCIGSRWTVDTLGAGMAAHALALDGVAAMAAPTAAGAVTAELIASLGSEGAKVFVLSYFSPQPQEHAQYFSRRLKRRWPDSKVILALWNVEGAELAALPISDWGVDAAVGSINALVTEVCARLKREGTVGWTPAQYGADDAQRVQALRDSGVLDASLRGTFDSAARRAADIFDVPVAMITLIDEQWQYTHGDSAKAGRLGVGEPERGPQRSDSMCGHVVAGGAALVVPDVQRDPRFAANPALIENAIRFYAGAPLRDAEGHILGTLCLLDTQPRTMSLRDAKLLESLADEVMVPLRNRTRAAGTA